jgi:S1-C subfamily serine protease
VDVASRLWPCRTTAAVALLVGIASACSPAPSDALDSIYKVEVGQCLAVETQLATAVAVAPDRLVSVAHSLDEADGFTVLGSGGVEIDATLVYIDPGKDIAIFEVPDGSAQPLEIGEPASTGAVSIATGARGDEPTVKDAAILDLLDATLDGEGKRAAIKLDADIKPGDSGAAVVDESGRMVGMVFATARGENIGWAIAGGELTAALDELGRQGSASISLSC